MIDKPQIEQIRSLATVRDGETLVVENILFDANRARLAAAGVAEGDRIRCHAATPSYVAIETPLGVVMNVDRAWASFVQVSRADRSETSANAI